MITRLFQTNKFLDCLLARKKNNNHKPAIPLLFARAKFHITVGPQFSWLLHCIGLVTIISITVLNHLPVDIENFGFDLCWNPSYNCNFPLRLSAQRFNLKHIWNNDSHKNNAVCPERLHSSPLSITDKNGIIRRSQNACRWAHSKGALIYQLESQRGPGNSPFTGILTLENMF